jgi:putative flippase GtrA
VSTVLYAALFVGLTHAIATLLANAIALVISTACNTEVNRRFTFGVRGASRRLAAHLSGAVSLLTALVMTTVALDVVGALAHRRATFADLAATITATAVATAVRYLLMSRFALPRQQVSGAAGTQGTLSALTSDAQ